MSTWAHLYIPHTERLEKEKPVHIGRCIHICICQLKYIRMHAPVHNRMLANNVCMHAHTVRTASWLERFTTGFLPQVCPLDDPPL